jgi:hypothetical protein
MSSRGYTVTKQIRLERRARAEQIAIESGWSKLTLQQQLAKLPEGGASRQRARIQLRLQNQENEAVHKAEQAKVAEQAKQVKQAAAAAKSDVSKKSKKEGK